MFCIVRLAGSTLALPRGSGVSQQPFADEGLANEAALAETPKGPVQGLFRAQVTAFPAKGFVL